MPLMAALAMLVLTAACGTSPAAPGTPARYVITAGTFTLTLVPAPVTICFSTGPGVGTNISIPVTLQREGAAWIARPATGTLTMTMTETGDGVEGALEGAFTLGQVTVTVGMPGTPASISAPTLGASTLGGTVQGDVSYTSGSAQSSCTSNAWSLARR